MQTLVEEYTSEVPATEIAQLAEDGETLGLIEELGLSGQKSLYRSEDKSEPVKPHPYRVITAEELAVFSAVFPNRECVTKYKGGPIPLRVLQIVSHVKSLEHKDMKYLEVWSPKPGIADPLLVARPSYWGDPIFILARWGSALLPFAKLRDRAADIITTRVRADLTKSKAKIDQVLVDLRSTVIAKLNEGVTFTPYHNLE